jgi:hypothetical protein
MTDEDIRELGKKILLMELCKKFIRDNGIHCVETIYQTDHVITNAYDFIADICDIVGYVE